MRKFIKYAIAAAIASGSAAHAAVGDTLDPFTVVQSVEDKTSSTSYNSGVHATQVAGAGIFGGYRDIYVQKTSNVAFDNVRGVQAAAAVGEFSFSEDTNQIGFAVLRWDGAVSNGLATDLTDPNPANWILAADTSNVLGNLYDFGTGFSFSYSSDFVFQVTLLVYTNTGIGIAQETTDATGIGNYKTDSVQFSEFVPLVGSIDFTNVRAIEVVFNGNLAQASVDLAFTPPTGIPEPASIALAGLALLGVAAARRRKA
jgi:hypothetical protein